MNEKGRDITREELYKLIWSKSLVLAANELGISDVGLAKICKRLNVPRPYRGYWAQSASGRKLSIPPLSAAKEDAPTSAWITRYAKPQTTAEEQTRSALIESESLPENRIVVPDNLRRSSARSRDEEETRAQLTKFRQPRVSQLELQRKTT